MIFSIVQQCGAQSFPAKTTSSLYDAEWPSSQTPQGPLATDHCLPNEILIGTGSTEKKEALATRRDEGLELNNTTLPTTQDHSGKNGCPWGASHTNLAAQNSINQPSTPEFPEHKTFNDQH